MDDNRKGEPPPHRQQSHHPRMLPPPHPSLQYNQRMSPPPPPSMAAASLSHPSLPPQPQPQAPPPAMSQSQQQQQPSLQPLQPSRQQSPQQGTHKMQSPATLSELEELPLLKPPQLNNVQDISDIAWFSHIDGHPYVQIRLKTKGTLCRADFHDLSPKKQQELIERLRARRTARDDDGHPAVSEDEADRLLGLVAYMEKHKRFVQIPAKRGLSEEEESISHRKRIASPMSLPHAQSPILQVPPNPYGPPIYLPPAHSPFTPPAPGPPIYYQQQQQQQQQPPPSPLPPGGDRLDESVRYLRDLHETCTKLRQENYSLRSEVAALRRQINSLHEENVSHRAECHRLQQQHRTQSHSSATSPHPSTDHLPPATPSTPQPSQPNIARIEHILNKYAPSIHDRLAESLRKVAYDIHAEMQNTSTQSDWGKKPNDKN
ncbi:uncharacterized protein SPPG_08640 [Spizellomyces punctatus DAOM BR117]|uniref:Uncharacterized protein n=1 Tax=Spizellomyces punctatus (strain DAOM BR117) TaxID=645134 RepID=A0A0L0H3J7_SPIPD|nr:uncharacterized protein SPPG_08640 [Spizellomyces punctatus DAOM BR117]KNC96045.1 hypothetical protein SPPG_08640 [Spizellomyces punctatus DAOM BR117]|eukprot:XP_016604085.1 hypothetical protein SPPG_08640 [Spizellomyces punctatus DAOM BR117]